MKILSFEFQSAGRMGERPRGEAAQPLPAIPWQPLKWKSAEHMIGERFVLFPKPYAESTHMVKKAPIVFAIPNLSGVSP